MAKVTSSDTTGASGGHASGPASATFRRIVSGDVPHDPAENVTYVVVDSGDKHVVASFKLPGHANIPKFRIVVPVPSQTDSYEAGRLDEHGNFKRYDFTVSEVSH